MKVRVYNVDIWKGLVSVVFIVYWFDVGEVIIGICIYWGYMLIKYRLLSMCKVGDGG